MRPPSGDHDGEEWRPDNPVRRSNRSEPSGSMTYRPGGGQPGPDIAHAYASLVPSEDQSRSNGARQPNSPPRMCVSFPVVVSSTWRPAWGLLAAKVLIEYASCLPSGDQSTLCSTPHSAV